MLLSICSGQRPTIRRAVFVEDSYTHTAFKSCLVLSPVKTIRKFEVSWLDSIASSTSSRNR